MYRLPFKFAGILLSSASNIDYNYYVNATSREVSTHRRILQCMCITLGNTDGPPNRVNIGLPLLLEPMEFDFDLENTQICFNISCLDLKHFFIFFRSTRCLFFLWIIIHSYKYIMYTSIIGPLAILL